MSTVDIKHSLEAVAGNLATIKRLTITARQLYESNGMSSPRTPKLPIQTGFSHTNDKFLSTQTLKLGAAKTSTSSIESGRKGLSRLTTNEYMTSRDGSSHELSDLPSLLDLITSKYNQQIGVLVGSIDQLTKRLESVKKENRQLRKGVRSSYKLPSRRKNSQRESPKEQLDMPILPEFSIVNDQPSTLQSRRRKNSSLVVFKQPCKKPDPLRKVRAAPLVSTHYDKFKKKLSQLNSNALADYL